MKQTSYDVVPYASHPYAQSRPERLATIAGLFGLEAPEVGRARVLELGSAAGGNIIPLAEAFPESEFVGVDASSRQIGDAHETVSKLGLRNIRFLHRDIMEMDAGLGAFDYIICHGVYSWVPTAVQEKILSVCKGLLSERGVAYVSYNTNPGWRLRGVIRDIMWYRARKFEAPASKLKQARNLLEFLARSTPTEENAYGILLRQELEQIRDKQDDYLLHEYLEETNDPIYFHQFVERAAGHGLQYLGEADYGSMAAGNLPAEVETMLQAVASDVIELEQHMDLVRNRMFRQTLLCHAEATLDRTVRPERLLGLHVASPVRPERRGAQEQGDGRMVFRGPSSTTTTSDPLVAAALTQLGEVYPRSLAFSELLSIASSRTRQTASVIDPRSVGPETRRLAQPLVRCYATHAVELSVRGAGFTTAVGDRPRTTAGARLQAERSARVTSLRHESVQLTDLERALVRQLDGRRERGELLAGLVAMAESGALIVHEGGQAVRERGRLAQQLAGAMEGALESLARRALLW